MSGLDDLFVAGYSFIQTSSIANDRTVSYEDNNDVRMGESISLKGNQIGYLIPGECIGVDSSGKSLYNRNPITYAEYSAIMEDDDYTEVDDSIVSPKTGHKLSYYLENGESISDCVTTVFVPTNSGQESDGLVYYYISSNDNYKEDLKWELLKQRCRQLVEVFRISILRKLCLMIWGLRQYLHMEWLKTVETIRRVLTM